MTKLLRCLPVVVLLLTACGGDDGGGDASTEAFCEVAEELAAGDGAPPPESMEALLDAAPDEIADDVERVATVWIQAAEAEEQGDQDAFAEAMESASTPEFDESSRAIEAYGSEECGIDVEGVDGGETTDDGADDNEDDVDFDFDFVGVRGAEVAEVADVDLAGHGFTGGIVNDGVDRLQLFVDDIDEDDAVTICERVADHVAGHPDASGRGELSIEAQTGDGTTQIAVVTTIAPGDPGSCEPGGTS